MATRGQPADHPHQQGDTDTEATAQPAVHMAMAVLGDLHTEARRPIKSTSLGNTRSGKMVSLNRSNGCCRGHYSDAVLSSLESQNDAEVEGISAKVKMLKDVRILHQQFFRRGGDSSSGTVTDKLLALFGYWRRNPRHLIPRKP